ncbi:MAG TPA: M50 family metallopeptidase [Bacillota bacterium]|jgi:regulator of sigma E protease|nr:M50 family metallopeptidase [Bacillota bacterium]HOL09828.1 M50 family metallopeptidase [Bacillota bacterium]HPO97705.1 M50 family metallopeptidase [Bacillota bacterium]
MSFLNSIWQTVLLLSILVVVHEFGHFIMARLFGVKVYEFSIGFGPLIGKITKNNIQYSFRWFLLGGFVKIAGLDIALEGEEQEGTSETEPVKTFQDISLLQKIAVIAAGPVFNIILTIILVFVTAAFVGVPSRIKDEEPVIEQAIPGTPAFNAGLRPGDRLVEINNEPVKVWSDIPRLVNKYGGETLDVKILRNNEYFNKQITPIYNQESYFIGIERQAVYERMPVGEAFKKAFSYTWELISATVKTFYLIFTGKLKDGFMGPIGMVTVMEQNTQLPLYYTMILAVQISLFLGMFNLLPIPLPLLDGGWIVILLLEKLLRREFTAEQKAAAQMVGLSLVLILGVMIAYSDILRSIQRFFGG